MIFYLEQSYQSNPLSPFGNHPGTVSPNPQFHSLTFKSLHWGGGFPYRRICQLCHTRSLHIGPAPEARCAHCTAHFARSTGQWKMMHALKQSVASAYLANVPVVRRSPLHDECCLTVGATRRKFASRRCKLRCCCISTRRLECGHRFPAQVDSSPLATFWLRGSARREEFGPKSVKGYQLYRRFDFLS